MIDHMKKIFLYSAMVLLAACSKDNGPSPDDNFLAYEIPEIPVTEDYTVGAIYYEIGTFSPNVKEVPTVGKYNMPNGVVPAAIMQQHIAFADKAKLDYFLFSFRSFSRDNGAFRRDSTIIRTYLNNVGASPLGFAVTYNWNSGTYGVSATAPLENDAVKLEQFYKDIEKISVWLNDPHYLEVNGRKVLYINNAHQLFSNNNKNIYKTLRTRMKALGFDLYIVGMQDRWTPPARYNFRYDSCVDAIYHQNFRPDNWDRFYLLPQFTDQNWKYSKEYFKKNWNVDYVPNIFPAYNYLINTPTSLNPNVERKDSGAMFKKLCNVAKMNASEDTRLILIDSFNKWDEDLQIEPAQSYGELYLNIIRTQFKK